MKIGNLNNTTLRIQDKVNSSKEEEVSSEELQILMYGKLKTISNWLTFFGQVTISIITYNLTSYILEAMGIM